MNAASDAHQLLSPPASELFLGDPRFLDPDSHTDISSPLAHHSTPGVLDVDTDFGDAQSDMFDAHSRKGLRSLFVDEVMAFDDFSAVIDHDSQSGPASPDYSYSIGPEPETRSRSRPVFFAHQDSTNAQLRHDKSRDTPFLYLGSPSAPSNEDVDELAWSLSPHVIEFMPPASCDSGYATHGEGNRNDELTPELAALLEDTSRFPTSGLPPTLLTARTDDRRGVGFFGPAPPTPPAWDWGSGSVIFPAPTSLMLAALIDEIYDEYYGEVNEHLVLLL
jgi:hypothetical protein